jgi:serine/threonine protein kinase
MSVIDKKNLDEYVRIKDEINKEILKLNLFITEKVIFNDRSCVFLAESKKSKDIFVVKVRDKKNNNMLIESKCLDELDHPNIVKKCGYFETKNFRVLILENIDGICLVDYIELGNILSENETKIVTKQILEVLLYLEKKNIVYMDMKPDNIMFNPETLRITIIDFEMVHKYNSKKIYTNKCGTKEYCSPEVKRGNYNGPETLIWSLGITIHVIRTGVFPKFMKNNEKEIYDPKKSTILSENLGDLIKKMIEYDCKKRITLKGIQQHNWLE